MPSHIWRRQPSNRLRSSDLIKNNNDDISYKVANKGFFELSPDIILEGHLKTYLDSRWGSSKILKVWNGIGWVPKLIKVWNGSNFIDVRNL